MAAGGDLTWGTGAFPDSDWGVADTKSASANKSTSDLSLFKSDWAVGTGTGESKRSPIKFWPKRSTWLLPAGVSVQQKFQGKVNFKPSIRNTLLASVVYKITTLGCSYYSISCRKLIMALELLEFNHAKQKARSCLRMAWILQ